MNETQIKGGWTQNEAGIHNHERWGRKDGRSAFIGTIPAACHLGRGGGGRGDGKQNLGRTLEGTPGPSRESA